MMTGLPPFYNKDTNKMYENILNKELIFPDYLKESICNLIQGMMQKDPTKRLQSIAEVKRHPWLRDVKWDDILNKRL
jgi:serine/threonine protein kinase